MAPQDDIAMALLEVLLESERQKKRELEVSLWALQVAVGKKQRERSMLIRKKQRLLGKQATEENLVDDFMVFVGAIDNNDLQIVQNFDENEMMNAIVTLLSNNDGDGGENEGFSDNDEGVDSGIENAQNLGAPDGTNNDGSEEGSDAGGHGRD